MCGLGHVQFAGHAHSRHWLNEPGALCGTEMIVSGAGASVTEIRDRGNVARYEDATRPGFLHVDIDGDSFTGTFYDSTGAVDDTYSFTRPRSSCEHRQGHPLGGDVEPEPHQHARRRRRALPEMATARDNHGTFGCVSA